MADLNAIYTETGIPGIIPYAIRDKSGGRQLLIKKLTEGEPLFALVSVLNMPFLIVKDGVYQMSLFSSEELAKQKVQELESQRFETSLEEVPTNKEAREDYFLRACNNGVSAVLLNDTISLPVSIFTDVPSYDGCPHEGRLLRNQALNGAISYYMQIAYGQMSNYEAETCWVQAMTKSKFLLVVKDDAENGYPLVTIQINDNSCLLVYTDWSQAAAGLEALGASQGRPCSCVVTFSELMEIMESYPEFSILLNSNTYHLVMSKSMLEQIYQAASSPSSIRGTTFISGTSSLKQVDEDDWDVADPMPDWLR